MSVRGLEANIFSSSQAVWFCPAFETVILSLFFILQYENIALAYNV